MQSTSQRCRRRRNRNHRIRLIALACITLFTLIAALVGVGCGAQPPSEPVKPLGGPVNTGGKPDVDKSHGAVGPGGSVNTSGAPDVNKSHGAITTGGPINTAGIPPKIDLGTKDGGK